MRVLLLGTYDAASHPRVAVLTEGLRERGVVVDEANAPLGLDTAARVAMLRQPWRVPALLARIVTCWWRITRASRRLTRQASPDAVLVGYLGHFDVHLARRLHPRTPVVLDHLLFASDTARDRGETGGVKQALLRRLDEAALRAADVVVVDTEEHRAEIPPALRERAVVVPVGAPRAWYAAGEAAAREERGGRPLRVAFFGLYTPLQGAPVIGAALALLAGEEVEVTMIGDGQDLAATRAAAGTGPGPGRVRWLPWVPGAQLPGLVAAHDVCLGIFGTGPKALRVVPNKVYQGLAAGCAVVTSDTAPQRRVLGAAAVLVPPGDPAALAGALRGLAHDRVGLDGLRRRGARAAEGFRPSKVVGLLLERLAAD